jgi:hypothetical protein
MRVVCYGVLTMYQSWGIHSSDLVQIQVSFAIMEKFGSKLRSEHEPTITGPNTDLGLGFSSGTLNARTHLLIRVPPDYPSLHRLHSFTSKLRPPSFSHLTLVGLASPTFVLESCHRLTLSFRVPPLSCCIILRRGRSRLRTPALPLPLAPRFSHPILTLPTVFVPSSLRTRFIPSSCVLSFVLSRALPYPLVILVARLVTPALPRLLATISTHGSLQAPFTLVRVLLFVFPVPYSLPPIPSPLACPPGSLASPWSSRLLTPALPSGRRWYSVYLFITSLRWSPFGFWHSMVSYLLFFPFWVPLGIKHHAF